MSFATQIRNIAMENYYEKLCRPGYSNGSRHYWLKKMVELYNEDEGLTYYWKYTENAYLLIDRFTKKEHKHNKKRQDFVFVEDESNIFPIGTEQCYIMRFMDENGELLFSKIGATTRDIRQRGKELLASYNAKMVYIDKVFDCKTINAKTIEGLLQQYAKKHYSENYIPNDRFSNIAFDVKKMESVFKKYLYHILLAESEV